MASTLQDLIETSIYSPMWKAYKQGVGYSIACPFFSYYL